MVLFKMSPPTGTKKMSIRFVFINCNSFLLLTSELLGFVYYFSYSVLRYDMKNLEIPTIGVVGSLVKSGIRVLVYRYGI